MVAELDQDIRGVTVVSEAHSDKQRTKLKETARKLLRDRQQLPVYRERNRLLESIDGSQVVIVVGETGSGKTTQLPQFLFEMGKKYLRNNKSIACTQPRRVAALSLAKRVAEEVGTTVGDLVGYKIRFEDKTSHSTKITYMTDGMLLREILNDPLLARYSVILLDEAHERTLRTDILFGMIKMIMKQRKADLKVIVMSATLQAEKFSIYFDNAPVVHISGRQYPVKLLTTKEPQADYLDAALVSIFQIHTEQADGDILVFLTGQEEIESLEKLINEHAPFCPPNAPKLLVCPLFANLPTYQQASVFSPAPQGFRKIVLSTNIAETSITISGIRYVVDCGLHKMRVYDPRTGMETLTIRPISKASSRQRSGRAGRESPGICYRLYTEETFNELKESDIPEIQRCNLANVTLNLKASNVNDVVNFDFMDRPSKDSLIQALHELYVLEALDREQNLTKLGREMSCFPLDPKFSKVLIKSKEFGCVRQCLDIIALLSIESLFYTPNEKREEAFIARKKFTSYDGDLLTLLNVLEVYLKTGKSKDWCSEHFINARSVNQVLDVRKQLLDYCKRLNFYSGDEEAVEFVASINERVLQAFLTSFYANIAVKQMDGSYKTIATKTSVYIHPASVLFNVKPDIVMYCDIIHTSKRYMKNTSRIEGDWFQSASGSNIFQPV